MVNFLGELGTGLVGFLERLAILNAQRRMLLHGLLGHLCLQPKLLHQVDCLRHQCLDRLLLLLEGGKIFVVHGRIVPTQQDVLPLLDLGLESHLHVVGAIDCHCQSRTIGHIRGLGLFRVDLCQCLQLAVHLEELAVVLSPLVPRRDQLLPDGGLLGCLRQGLVDSPRRLVLLPGLGDVFHLAFAVGYWQIGIQERAHRRFDLLGVLADGQQALYVGDQFVAEFFDGPSGDNRSVVAHATQQQRDCRNAQK